MDFRRALGKDGILPAHESNSYHKAAVLAANEYRQRLQNPSFRIDSVLVAQAEDFMRNKKA
jgi:hypothetical protein